jgi:hypothetical protein
MITESTITEINRAVGEALMLIPGEETIVLVTVACGYAELVSLNPANTGYLDRLVSSLFKLAEFVMERGRHNLARRLLLIQDEIRKGAA